MNDRKDFNKLLADEEFQNGMLRFDTFDRGKKETFIKQYFTCQEDFSKARTIINGLSYKERTFSEEELDYQWERLGIEGQVATLHPRKRSADIVYWFSRIAAVFFIPLLITSIWFFDRTQQLESFKRENVDLLTKTYNTVSAPIGGRTKAVLPDGSEVWLNAGSSIQYPLLNNKQYREVKLIGEGFFHVVENPDQPMLVNTSNMQIKVYGTTFNLNAYEDDSDIEAVLVEGNISIVELDGRGIPRGPELKMRPGELGRLNRQDNSLSITDANNMEVYTGWVNGKYVFRNMQLKEILKRLERLHNVDFILEDKTLGDYRFDATFEDQNIDRIMEIFSISLPIEWRSTKAEQSDDKTFSARQISISRDKSKELSMAR